MTDIKLAEHFGLTTQTLRNWRRGTPGQRRRVAAMEMFAEAGEMMKRRPWAAVLRGEKPPGESA